MYILGIGCYYHDASAALLKDGKIVVAAEEERFSRKKHDVSFPIKSIEYCLKSENITIKDINYIAFYEKPLIKFERVLSQYLEMFPLSLKTFLSSMPSWLNEKLRITTTIRKKLKYKGDIFFIDHHLSHAASSFLISPFKKATILTVDGVGEWTTTAYGIGKNNKIKLMKEIEFPSSLGMLYSTITAYLGFKVNNSEYKVMGLSAYGDMNKRTNPYYKKLKKVIDIKKDGSYRLDMRYFKYHYSNRMPSKKLCYLLKGEVRKGESKITKRHKDIAAALQLVYEEVLYKILDHVYEETKCNNIVISGGCALNGVANGKILKNTKFKNIWINPNPGDGGDCIGSALYIYHSLFGKDRNFILENAYLGPEFSPREIKKFLDKNRIKYTELKNEKELLKETASLIFDNKIVGWFQGRMEFGPRALGNRSILANPCNPKMKEILNKKVKHREDFRPFAPAICKEDVASIFETDRPLPKTTDFMLMIYPIKKEWQKKIPGVTHVDGSGRLQTIDKNQNRLFYGLIKKFEKISGIPVLINTSFNIRGEPIVCSPFDAYRCMMGTGIDCLVIDKFIVKRKDNLKDEWNSEKYAKD
jgi:carbamoyltransferase